MSIQTPFVTPFVSVRDFGAVPDDPSLEVRLANSKSFEQAQAAMQSHPFAWGHPLFVPSGTFFLADDLHIKKSLLLFGTGMQGESVLKFPAFKSLIIDPGEGNEGDPSIGGTECVICDLQIISEEDWVTDTAAPFNETNFDPPELESTSKGTPGIMMGSTATIQRVYIKGFSGTGIYLKKIGATNVNQWRIHDVYIESCGGHGIHVGGHGPEQHDAKSETQGGICTGAKIFTAEGNGIYDGSFGGNTYVGCYIEETKGRGFASDSPGQVSFIGCFAEAIEPVRLRGGGNVWVGGASGAGFTDDTTAFIAESYGNVHPFEAPNLKDPSIRLLVGYPNDGTDPTTICAWANNNGEFYVMRWDMDNKVWAIESGAIVPERDNDGNFLGLPELGARQIATYLTGTGHPRGPWLAGFREILLGPVDSPIKINRGDDPPADGMIGDIVFRATPQDDGFIGQVCIDSGPPPIWKRFGKIEP